MAAVITVVGRGHPAVRGSHRKTFEFTPDIDLGPGGTCVLAVRAAVDGAPLAGAVEGTLIAGAHQAAFTALANPGWDPTGRAVVRRSDVRKPDTLATHSSLAAGDLPAEFLDALRDPSQRVVLELRQARPQPDRLVVIASGEPSAAEQAAADRVLDAATATAASTETTVSGRTLVLGVPGLALLAAAPQPIEVYGVPVQQAVALASGSGAEPQLGTVHDVVAFRDRPVVLRVQTAEFDKVVRAARRHGRRTGALCARLPWVYRGDLGELRPVDGARVAWLCLDPALPSEIDTTELAIRVERARAGGASTKQVARALAEELGVPVKEVYARIVELAAGPAATI